MRWLKDKDFLRGHVPMTKFNIRILTMAYLGIGQGDRLLDIGAGTGSISVEAALQGARVWAIESNEEAIGLIRANRDKFKANIEIIQGKAPLDLPDISFNKCFVGGSGGRLKEIFSYLDRSLEDRAILVGNFISLKNLNNFIDLLDKHAYKDIEVNLIQGGYMDRIGLMKGQNPIYIVKGVKAND